MIGFHFTAQVDPVPDPASQQKLICVAVRPKSWPTVLKQFVKLGKMYKFLIKIQPNECCADYKDEHTSTVAPVGSWMSVDRQVTHETGAYPVVATKWFD